MRNNIKYYQEILANWDNVEYKTPEIKEHFHKYYKHKLTEAIKQESTNYSKLIVNPVIGKIIKEVYDNYYDYTFNQKYEHYYDYKDNLSELAWNTGTSRKKLEIYLRESHSEYEFMFRLICEGIIDESDYKMIKKR